MVKIPKSSKKIDECTMIDLRGILSNRIHLADIKMLVDIVCKDPKEFADLYSLLLDENELISYQAAWVLTHLDRNAVGYLSDKIESLISESMACNHVGRQRLLLTLIEKQDLVLTDKVDFLDFCLSKIVSVNEAVGIRVLCLKIAYKLCRDIPELMHEYKQILETMGEHLLPALVSARKNVLKDIRKNKL